MSGRITKIVAVCLLFLNAAGLEAQTAQEFTYDSKGRRDPFVPLIGQGHQREEDGNLSGELRLEGIILDPGKESLAVINGKVVKEGDSFGPYKVAKIERTSVLLSKENETFSLRLPSQK